MKKITFFASLFLGLLPSLMMAQTQEQESVPKDSLSDTLDEMLINAVRIDKKSPIAFSNMSKEELAKRNLGQDIPVLMNFLPSVVTTTDAGNGVGYTGIRVRGSDATRVNVTINGIPYNDSESHGTFWVNMPDFVSSLENLQLQRGVGTSTNGAGAFGASINMLTDAFSYEANGELATSVGSFNTRKHTAKFSTGLLNNTFELTGRFSDMYSDGYIDRAFSDMNSYFLQGTFVHDRTLIKALTFGGNQRTYQAWNGIEQDDLERFGRRYNTAGRYTDEEGNVRYYDNETDNYKQDHYQLHWNQRWSSKWNTNLALHYTKGFGFYENYRRNQDLEEYGLEPVTVDGEWIDSSNLIRRKFLDNDFYGTTFSLNYRDEKLDFVFGGAANKYKGYHYGDILWVQQPVAYDYKQEYYRDLSEKTDINTFAKATYKIEDKWILFGDLQYRYVHFTANGNETGIVDDTFNFFNPKAGLTYLINNRNQVYASYARAQREPNRNDYENGNPRPEKLNDFEWGWRYDHPLVKVNVNGYYMQYQDQLVLTGALNDVGAPLRENSGNSYRLGLEIDAVFRVNKFQFQPNLTLSSNKNMDFVSETDGQLVNHGNTNISFSPGVIAGNMITYTPVKGLSFTLLSKYVGEQFMGNTDSETSRLDAYFTNDINIIYELLLKRWFKSITFNVLANNVLNTAYISNGYYYTYDDNWSVPGQIRTIEGAGYYPQAQFNILGGIVLKF